jgi:hypothetical protein
MKNKPFHSFLNFIKKRDHYGAPITLTFDGEDTFKTLRGGVLTILVNIYLLVYVISQFRPVMTGRIS